MPWFGSGQSNPSLADGSSHAIDNQSVPSSELATIDSPTTTTNPTTTSPSTNNPSESNPINDLLTEKLGHDSTIVKILQSNPYFAAVSSF